MDPWQLNDVSDWFVVLSAYCLAPIGVSLAMKNKVQKNCGYKYKPFFVSHDQIQIIFWPKRAINKDEFCVECF